MTKPGKRKRSARPPSAFVRTVARFGVPLAAFCTVLTLAFLLALVLHITEGHGLASILLSFVGAACFGTGVYLLGSRLPRYVRDRDRTVEVLRRVNAAE